MDQEKLWRPDDILCKVNIYHIGKYENIGVLLMGNIFLCWGPKNGAKVYKFLSVLEIW